MRTDSHHSPHLRACNLRQRLLKPHPRRERRVEMIRLRNYLIKLTKGRLSI
jgi:hypothetical protein